MSEYLLSDDAPSLGVVQEAIRKLTKDEKAAAKITNRNEARFLVDAYYSMQHNRIRADGQVRSMSKDGEPHAVVQWLANMNRTLEESIKSALDAYSANHRAGQWMRSQKGIGPVIAAGFLAHLDITKAQTAGAFWSFAGLDPRAVWNKGEKRPWNADLKTLCWKLGESFVKVSGAEDAFYGRIYKERKALEVANNDAGLYAEQARLKLEKFKIGKDTDAYAAYAQGKLPPAHLHARAKRYAVKLFLANLHCVMYFDHYGIMPPLPYAIGILGHGHIIHPPHAEVVPGLLEACAASGPMRGV